MEQQQYRPVSQVSNTGLAQFFSRIYAYLGVGIAISAVTSYLVMEVFFFQVITFITSIPFGFMLMWILQIGLALFLSAKAVKKPTMAFASFVVYSMLMGVTLGLTLAMYAEASVYKAFIAAAVTYGAMAVVGTRTKKDLTGMGQALRGGLIGIIIVMLLNTFILKSSPVEIFISLITVVVFAGLTAYDHQKIKTAYAQVGDGPQLKGLAIFFALQLYLDFINLLLAFLRIFGRD